MNMLHCFKKILITICVIISLITTACAKYTVTMIKFNVDSQSSYVDQKSEDYFGVSEELTRYEFADMICNILDSDYRSDVSSNEVKYKDINQDSEYYDVIKVITNANIMFGYEDGTFKPNNIITRGEVVNVLVNMKPIPEGFKPKRTYLDIQETYNRDAIEYAATNHWTWGYEDWNFRPNKPVTKAEAIAILNRFLGRKWDKDSKIKEDLDFADVNKDAWYYKDLLLATGNVE